MNELLQRLKPKERRGSKPRCHFLTHGAPGQVAENLTQLISPFGSVSRPPNPRGTTTGTTIVAVAVDGRRNSP